MKMKITYQGVAGAYSNIAAMQVFPEQDYLPCDTFEEAMAPAAGAAWRPPGRYSGRVVASAGFGAVFRVFESARN